MKKSNFENLVYQGMSDQPDCCGGCGARLDLIETTIIDDELVYVCKCLGCHQTVLVVEMDVID
jgi:hypothetical protein